ncbi:hypothetical protein GQR58_011354 [Nymphon striatum]|nr:hypothetical protein GQR58_011354 [Nymphon striatum]
MDDLFRGKTCPQLVKNSIHLLKNSEVADLEIRTFFCGKPILACNVNRIIIQFNYRYRVYKIEIKRSDIYQNTLYFLIIGLMSIVRTENKAREYLERVLEIDHASFTPLDLGTNGGMGNECQKFVSALSTKLAEKQNKDYSVIVSWLRVHLSIAITKEVSLDVDKNRILQNHLLPFASLDPDMLISVSIL